MTAFGSKFFVMARHIEWNSESGDRSKPEERALLLPVKIDVESLGGRHRASQSVCITLTPPDDFNSPRNADEALERQAFTCNGTLRLSNFGNIQWVTAEVTIRCRWISIADTVVLCMQKEAGETPATNESVVMCLTPDIVRRGEGAIHGGEITQPTSLYVAVCAAPEGAVATDDEPMAELAPSVPDAAATEAMLRERIAADIRDALV